MDTRPLTIGILACVAVLAVVVLPWVALPATETAGLTTYYEFGIVGPWVVAAFALVALLLFGAARQGRTEGDTVAGSTLVLGVFAVALAAQWALAIDQAVLQSITTADWIVYHGPILVGVTLLVPVSAAWYARSLGVL